MSKHSFAAEYADLISVDESRAQKIKETKKRKRIEEAIAVALLQNNAKRAIELAEKYSLSPKEFGKLVAKYAK